MIFHFPWGLLALLSVPLIIGLHFFRSRKEVRRIGGLHLWEFARQRPPVGAKWDRLVRSLSLLFQILAAIVASLLLAGIDLPRQKSNRHFAVIVDDSLSMSANAPGSAAQRARQALLQWAGPGDRYTVIAAGARPRLLCEPYSSLAEMTAALAQWNPAAPSSDLSLASSLAAKFLVGDEKALCFTDNIHAATAYSSVLELWGVGQTLANNAIVFADRLRIDERRDRILLRVQRFADTEEAIELVASMSGRPFYRETVTLPPDRAVALAFETASINEPIEVRLPDDPLPGDHVAILAPVDTRPVRVACVAPGRLQDYVKRAALSVHHTFFVATPDADLFFIEGATGEYSARHVVRLPGAASPQGLMLAQGKDLLLDHADRRVADLPLEGLLWAYLPGLLEAGTRPALIEQATEPLLIAFRPAPRHMQYDLNLVWSRTNLFRHTAWPVLMQGMIERCRQDLPGMDRTNFRTGEPIRMTPREDAAGPAILLRDGQAMQTYDEPPVIFSDLPAGLYELTRGGARQARFAVNLLSSGESDLRPLSSREPVLANLVPSIVRETETHRRLFFALAAILITLMGLAWVCQDISR